jgi:hypothetical protein
MMRCQDIDPAFIAQITRLRCRIYDIGEHDRLDDSVDDAPRPPTGQEFFDSIDNLLGAPDIREVIHGIDLDELCRRDVLREIPSTFDRDRSIVTRVNDEGRDPNTLQ